MLSLRGTPMRATTIPLLSRGLFRPREVKKNSNKYGVQFFRAVGHSKCYQTATGPAATKKKCDSYSSRSISQIQLMPSDPLPLKRFKPVDIGEMKKVCDYCGALSFPGEKAKCCALGKVHSPSPQINKSGVPYTAAHAPHSSQTPRRTNSGCPQVPEQCRLLQQRLRDGFSPLHPRGDPRSRYSI